MSPRHLVRACTVALALLALAGIACGDGSDEPDGATPAPASQIVFQSDRAGADDIFIMRDDGSEPRRLTDAPGRDYEPDSRPDGEAIVFVSDRAGDGNADLYEMELAGGEPRRLTFGGGGEGERVVNDYPHWAPGGTKIVFQRTTTKPDGANDADIWLLDVASGDETQLTDTPDDWDSTPSFIADSSAVLFESNRDGDFDIYRLDLETRELTQLTNGPGADLEAKAAHHGDQIAFASERDGDFEVYVMDADGGSPQHLTANDALDRCPHWSPDGSRISFYSNRDGNQEVYVMQADGSDQVRLTQTLGREEVPDWIEAP